MNAAPVDRHGPLLGWSCTAWECCLDWPALPCRPDNRHRAQRVINHCRVTVVHTGDPTFLDASLWVAPPFLKPPRSLRACHEHRYLFTGLNPAQIDAPFELDEASVAPVTAPAIHQFPIRNAIQGAPPNVDKCMAISRFSICHAVNSIRFCIEEIFIRHDR